MTNGLEVLPAAAARGNAIHRLATLGLMQASVSVVVLALLAVLAFLAASPLNADFVFHLKAGEWIVAHGALPANDPFSFTRPDAHWLAFEWLFQVIVFALFKAGGFMGVKFFAALIVLGTLILVLRTARRAASEAAAVTITIAVALAVLPWSPPRPQIITFLLFAFFLRTILAYTDTGNARALRPLPILTMLWANLHGGFVLGLLLIGVAGFARWAQRVLNPVEQNARALPLLACCAACVLASAVNPYHFKLLAYPFTLSMMSSTRLITEWMSPQLRDPVTLVVAGLVLAWGLAQLARDRSPPPIDVALPCFILLMAMDSKRHLPLAAIALGMFLARALGDGAARRTSDLLRRIAPSVVGGSSHATAPLPDKVVHSLNWVLLAGIAALAIYAYPITSKGLAEAENKPGGWKAIDYVATARICGRGFNELSFGGYHIYRLHPAKQVFVDLRADTYGDDFMREYMTILNGEEGWDVAFDKYSLDYVVVGKATALRQLLLTRGDFEEVYRDEHNVVLTRRGGCHRPH
jgi:hypothetical protein